jgi:hypothetical protein
MAGIMAPGMSGPAPLVFLRRRPARGAIDGAALGFSAVSGM